MEVAEDWRVARRPWRGLLAYNAEVIHALGMGARFGAQWRAVNIAYIGEILRNPGHRGRHRHYGENDPLCPSVLHPWRWARP